MVLAVLVVTARRDYIEVLNVSSIRGKERKLAFPTNERLRIYNPPFVMPSFVKLDSLTRVESSDWKTLSKQDIDLYYGKTPIIYATEESYDRFIAGDFEENPLWIRSVYNGVAKDIDWTFWQFSNRHVLSGYKGDERFIDMNVYNGAAEEFRKQFG